ncbi:MAG: hypothetical protein KAG61_08085, partial [Bacteriovoracaceae bacterium]|nr:hypothetical protein [Bacteriovoracaceae bacterium]
IPFFFISTAFGGIDLASVDIEIKKVIRNIAKEKVFSNKFKHVTYIEGIFEKEISKVNDKNYEEEKGKLFMLNFYHGNILELTTAFPQEDCQYQRERLVRNFSDYKTGKIHKKIKLLAKVPLAIFDSICNKK